MSHMPITPTTGTSWPRGVAVCLLWRMRSAFSIEQYWMRFKEITYLSSKTHFFGTSSDSTRRHWSIGCACIWLNRYKYSTFLAYVYREFYQNSASRLRCSFTVVFSIQLTPFYWWFYSFQNCTAFCLKLNGLRKHAKIRIICSSGTMA